MISRDPYDALVLAGGGANGAYQVGVLTRLAELGFRAKRIYGNSVGAITGAGLAHYPLEQFSEGVAWVKRLWLERIHSSRDVYRYHRPRILAPIFWPSLAHTRPLRALLEEVVDPLTIQQSGVELRMTAVDLLTGRLAIFTETAHDLIEVIMASASYPGVFPPVQIEGGWYTDGGVLDIVPFRHAVDDGCEMIMVIHNEGPVPRYKRGKLLSVLLRSAYLMANEIVRTDLEFPHSACVTTIGPSKDLGDSLDFSARLNQRRIQLGYVDALNAVGGP